MKSKTRKPAKRSKTSKIMPFCACGCGARTKGGSFKMGHDQRLRGTLKRAEAINKVTRDFIQRERGEWLKLLADGRKSPKAKARRKVQKSLQRKPRAREALRVVSAGSTAPQQAAQA